METEHEFNRMPYTHLEVIKLMRRVSQRVYDAGVRSDYSDGTEFIADLQAHDTIERLLRELEGHQ